MFSVIKSEGRQVLPFYQMDIQMLILIKPTKRGNRVARIEWINCNTIILLQSSPRRNLDVLHEVL